MNMATPATPNKEHEQHEPRKASKPQLVVVELAKRRSSEQVRRLRKGRGKLIEDIDDAVAELVDAGTIKADAQPVVIVVREAELSLSWAIDDDDDDDVDDDDDDDDD
jgi:Family of unknown function (DUF6200)